MDERELRREQALQRAREQARVGRAVAAPRHSLVKDQRLRPTWRGAGTLVVGTAALLIGYAGGRREILVVGAAALLLSVGGLLVARIRRPRLEVSRRFSPPVVPAGSLVLVTLRLQNQGTGPSPHLIWNDAIPWQESAAPNELLPIGVGSGDRRVVTVSYQLRPPRRGVYQVGPMVVEHEDPFGMARSTLALGQADRLIVVPTVVELPSGGPSLADGEGTAQLVQRRVTGNDDDLTTREYRAGDALRRVHWRASARRGELMVRQEEHRSHPDARILFDTRLGGYPDVVADESESGSPRFSSEAFEWAVRMLASLGVHLDGSGFQVSIEETARPQVDQLGERWDGSRREGFLTSLAGVSLVSSAAGGPLPQGPATQPTGPVFAIAGDPDEPTLDWLIRRRRVGDAAIAFLVDPRPQTVKRLGDAGWLCVPVQAWDEPPTAWRASSTNATLGWARRL